MRAATLLVLLAALTGISHGAPITVPAGLSRGDQYRLAFVTSTVRTGRSRDIADYNAFVTSAANSVPELVALGTTWRAVVSTNASTPQLSFITDARDNTATNPDVS